jgi:cystathionine beta-lyase/cystathionine gamma-synthase
VALDSVAINPSATNSGMDILTLLSKHPLPSCLRHQQLASLKQHSVAMSNNSTFAVTFQGFNAEAFLVKVEIYEHSHVVSFQEVKP